MPIKDKRQKNWVWASEADQAKFANDAKVAVFDLDDVLSDSHQRQHYLAGTGKKNWKAFHAAGDKDPVLDIGLAFYNERVQDHLIVILTGRDLGYNELTTRWLERNSIEFNLLIMRKDGDFTPGPDYKAWEIQRLQRMGVSVECVYDDNEKIIARMQKMGLNGQLIVPR